MSDLFGGVRFPQFEHNNKSWHDICRLLKEEEPFERAFKALEARGDQGLDVVAPPREEASLFRLRHRDVEILESRGESIWTVEGNPDLFSIDDLGVPQVFRLRLADQLVFFADGEIDVGQEDEDLRLRSGGKSALKISLEFLPDDLLLSVRVVGLVDKANRTEGTLLLPEHRLDVSSAIRPSSRMTWIDFGESLV